MKCWGAIIVIAPHVFALVLLLMHAARLYILCGLPFAGKTTLAKRLAERFGFVHLDMDRINSILGVGLNGEAITPEQWDRTYAECYRQLEEYLQAGQTVIFDTAAFTRAQRDELRAIAGKRNVPTQVIYLAISEEEARRRWQQNRVTQQRYDVRDEDFDQVARHFEPPAPDEHVIVYEPPQPLDDWIHQHF